MNKRNGGQCIHCKSFFNATIQFFTPERIRAIRKTLGEGRGDFGHRFFVGSSTVKSWELSKKNNGHRKLPKPAIRVMIAVEKEALKLKKSRNEALRKILERNHKSLTKKYAHLFPNG